MQISDTHLGFDQNIQVSICEQADNCIAFEYRISTWDVLRWMFEYHISTWDVIRWMFEYRISTWDVIRWMFEYRISTWDV